MIFEHGGIEREPDERGDEQADAGQPQTRMRHAMKQPQQRHAFQRPADGDPLPVELDRENQRDEKQRHAAEPGQLGHARFVFGGNCFQDDDQAQQSGNRKRRGQQSHELIRIDGGYETVE